MGQVACSLSNQTSGAGPVTPTQRDKGWLQQPAPSEVEAPEGSIKSVSDIVQKVYFVSTEHQLPTDALIINMSYQDILLSQEELACAAHSFLVTIYGEEILEKWRNLKVKMGFSGERDFMSWLLDAGDAMVSDDAKDIDDKQQYYDDDGDVIDDDKSHLLPLQTGALSETGALGEIQHSGHQYEDNDVVEIDDCDDDPTSLQQHQRMMSTSEYRARRSYQCPLCTFESTTSQYHVRRHIMAVHEKKKPHQCPHCNYTASQREAVGAHLIYKHNYTSKYRCDQCGKGFHTKTFIKTHRCTSKS